jgi:4-hydroxy-2-oxoheptanedioate aldolase
VTPLKDWQETGVTFGAWLSVPSPATAELFAASAFAWCCLDMQHGAIHEGNLEGLLHAMAAAQTPAIVRVGWNEPRLIMWALDMGASGVIVPMVNTVEDAENIADALYYPPKGTRSFGTIRNGYDADPGEVFGLAMIETQEGLDQVERIASVDGLAGIFIGPVDLALSIGLTRQDALDGHEKLDAAYARIVAAGQANGKIIGSICIHPSHAETFLDLGMGLVALNSDRAYVTRGLAADAARIPALRTRARAVGGTGDAG